MSPDKGDDVVASEAKVNQRLNGYDDPRFLESEKDPATQKVEYTPRIKWPDLAAQIFIHAGGFYGIYLIIFEAKLLTSLWGNFLLLIIIICENITFDDNLFLLTTLPRILSHSVE